jgi:hypothetical protein
MCCDKSNFGVIGFHDLCLSIMALSSFERLIDFGIQIPNCYPLISLKLR